MDGGEGGAVAVQREGPRWLDAFVAAKYFSHCTRHRFGKSECNFFCTDCGEGPLCAAGVREGHVTHFVLQARKASYKDAIRICDVQRILDIAGIETYIINGAKIVFLHRRPQANPPQGVPNCEMCKRSFRDQVRFCSIQCKLDAIRKDSRDASLSLHAMGEFEETCITKMDQGVIINPKPVAAVTNFRVHGEQLIRNQTPPRLVWNFLNQVDPIPAAASEPAIGPEFSPHAQQASFSGMSDLNIARVGCSESTEQSSASSCPLPASISPHKGRRIIPMGSQLKSEFSLDSWLKECKGKRKGDALHCSLSPMQEAGEDQGEFSFFGNQQAALAAAPRLIIPKTHRIGVDSRGVAHPQHSPSSSTLSDLSDTSQPAARGVAECYDCTCLALNTPHSGSPLCSPFGPSTPVRLDRSFSRAIHARKGAPRRAPMK